MARERLKTSSSNINNHNVGKLGKRGAWNAHLAGADSLACACGILGLDVPERKKGNRKLLLKYILRQLNFEKGEGGDDGGSSWYAKIHDHLRVSFSKKATHLPVSNKNLN